MSNGYHTGRTIHIAAGSVFGRLAATEDSTIVRLQSGKTASVCRCLCECGQTRVVQVSSLLKGDTKSCGCLCRERSRERATRHGDKLGGQTTKLYRAWTSMKTRCQNAKVPHYRYYGGRGIQNCREWDEFSAFKDWAESHGYRDGLSIERIDVNGNYEPSNCAWIERSRQAFNKRTSLKITAFGETKSLSEWLLDSRCVGTSKSIRLRIHQRGWDGQRAITDRPRPRTKRPMPCPT